MGVPHTPRGGIRCRVCNRAAVVDGEDGRVSPHSRLRRQCGVIEVVTAPRLISRGHLQALNRADDVM